MCSALGEMLRPAEPDGARIRVEDIAHALSQICRFGGHTREFYCPTPEQRILTADLQWIPAGDIKVGDRLVGFDEHAHEMGSAGKRRRRLRPSIVTHAQMVERPVIRLEMSDGSTVRASAEHPWLTATKASGNQAWKTSERIAADVRAGRTRYMHRLAEPWAPETSWEGGWLAGMYDGEGCLRMDSKAGMTLGISQLPGVVLEEVAAALQRRGFNFTRGGTGARRAVTTLALRGGWEEVTRLLGSVRPMRLLNKFETSLHADGFGRQLRAIGPPVQVTRAYNEGSEWVAGLETSTHTYICEGYGAHNSVAQHSVLVSLHCHPRDGLDGLMHDAAEYVLGDIPSPLKRLLPDWKALETEWNTAVRRTFNLSPELPESVKRADLRLLATEARDLLPPTAETMAWINSLGARPIEGLVVEPWPPETARWWFTTRFNSLMRAHGGER
jgi:hypothetical protein